MSPLIENLEIPKVPSQMIRAVPNLLDDAPEHLPTTAEQTDFESQTGAENGVQVSTAPEPLLTPVQTEAGAGGSGSGKEWVRALPNLYSDGKPHDLQQSNLELEGQHNASAAVEGPPIFNIQPTNMPNIKKCKLSVNTNGQGQLPVVDIRNSVPTTNGGNLPAPVPLMVPVGVQSASLRQVSSGESISGNGNLRDSTGGAGSNRLSPSNGTATSFTLGSLKPLGISSTQSQFRPAPASVEQTSRSLAGFTPKGLQVGNVSAGLSQKNHTPSLGSNGGRIQAPQFTNVVSDLPRAPSSTGGSLNVSKERKGSFHLTLPRGPMSNASMTNLANFNRKPVTAAQVLAQEVLRGEKDLVSLDSPSQSPIPDEDSRNAMAAAVAAATAAATQNQNAVTGRVSNATVKDLPFPNGGASPWAAASPVERLSPVKNSDESEWILLDEVDVQEAQSATIVENSQHGQSTFFAQDPQTPSGSVRIPVTSASQMHIPAIPAPVKTRPPKLHSHKVPATSERCAIPDSVVACYLPDYLDLVEKGGFYDAEKNPNGVVSLSVAENKQCIEMLRAKLEKTRLTKLEMSDTLYGYNNFNGSEQIRTALARVLERFVFRNGVTVDPARLVVSNGCTCTIAMLGQVISDGEAARGQGIGLKRPVKVDQKKASPVQVVAPPISIPEQEPAKETTSGIFGGLSAICGAICGAPQATPLPPTASSSFMVAPTPLPPLPTFNSKTDSRIGKKVLYVSPRYPGFKLDFRGFSDVETVEIAPNGSGRLPTPGELEMVWQQNVIEGGNGTNEIAAFLICNPENPTGVCYTQEELLACVNWCRKKEIYVISDEIYGAGVFSQCETESIKTFRPFFSLMEHADVTLWGLSKDFGTSGARVSVAYCPPREGGNANDKLFNGLTGRNFLHTLPNVAQAIYSQVLADHEWMHQYLSVCRNSCYEACELTKRALTRMRIPFVSSDGAMFLWVDFSEFKMESYSLFRHLLREYKVFLTPGCEFYEKQVDISSGEEKLREVYWMRVCFGACGGKVALTQGLDRLEKFVNDKRK